ncbi:hypothetical protein NC652_035534 [Populus alba x Populus x berolinensis]|nr:hypothetical protein NC652_035534 [Populus alba x Populus x berolinensis]
MEEIPADQLLYSGARSYPSPCQTINEPDFLRKTSDDTHRLLRLKSFPTKNYSGRAQNSPHHLLPLSSSSATLNNLQQRSRVHFGWEAGSPKPACKLSVHEDTLPWLFPCNFSCSAMDIIYLTLWHGPKKPKEEEIHITARLAMQPYTLPDHSLQNQLQPPAGIAQCQSSIQPAQPIQTYSTISGTSKYP